ncbi:thymidylate synthase [Candidatus Dojkabacteria bacterium]|uniref:Thymidylate synthase n=1 Tax=Candidatus Dojkabacteria bacterium TaxID=2099670 RepID=A0A5C7J363_9BACT|nr:MAG: thymidylate synthase [Candidatus Dojkabacteria bacterium]
MAKIDENFMTLCREILNNGKEYENKNRGVKRLQIPSYTFRHDFSDGFPAITNKKLYWKGIVTELIWFLRGDNDVKYLNENGVKIWNKDAYNWYKKHGGTLSFEEFERLGEGSVGQNYSVQWRKFNGNTDQIRNLISEMKSDIMSSRLKVNAWNPSELNETALPPCHSEFQVVGVPLEDGSFGFELHWNQRSVDVFLGLPFNIASYALLAKILENVTGYKALGIEGTLKCVHFYDNQYEAAKELISRDPNTHPNCEVTINPLSIETYSDIDDIFSNYRSSDFKLVGYTSDSEIKVEMLAPTS